MVINLLIGKVKHGIVWWVMAGTRIPEDSFTSVQSGGYKYCGTYCPGYLPSGSHPKTPGELVDNVEVCYNCNNEICSTGPETSWGTSQTML